MTGSGASVGGGGGAAAELAENRNPCSISGFHREVGRGSRSEAAEGEASQSGMHWPRVVAGLGSGLPAASGPQHTSLPLFCPGKALGGKSRKRASCPELSKMDILKLDWVCVCDTDK